MDSKRIREKSGVYLCGFCGSPDVRTVYKDELFGKSETAVIIENLPVRHCETCGENYYDPEVSRLIDEILAHPGERAVRRQINVVSLAA
jgi:YgiT-type zinc finger domain-containing protein